MRLAARAAKAERSAGVRAMPGSPWRDWVWWASALGAGFGGVGEDPAEGDVVALVGGVLQGEGAQTSDGVGAAGLDGGFGVVVGEGPVAIRRVVAPDAAVEAQGLVGVAGLGELSGLLQLFGLDLAGRRGLDFCDVGAGGVDLAEAVEIVVGLGVLAGELGGPGQAGEGVAVARVDEENLLPGLGREVVASGLLLGASARKEGGYGRGRRGLCRGRGGGLGDHHERSGERNGRQREDAQGFVFRWPLGIKLGVRMQGHGYSSSRCSRTTDIWRRRAWMRAAEPTEKNRRPSTRNQGP